MTASIQFYKVVKETFGPHDSFCKEKSEQFSFKKRKQNKEMPLEVIDMKAGDICIKFIPKLYEV